MTPAIAPASLATGAVYPSDEFLRAILGQSTDQVYWIQANEIALGLGNPKTANVVLLGALSALLDCDPSAWLDVLQLRIPPKYLDLNRQAFALRPLGDRDEVYHRGTEPLRRATEKFFV